MSTHDDANPELAAPPEDSEGVTRKQYQPPRILSREPLEALANVCNAYGSKADGVSCPYGPAQS